MHKLPVGNLRFNDPQPITTYRIYNATSLIWSSTAVWSSARFAVQNPLSGFDCLLITIWTTPATNFFIHTLPVWVLYTSKSAHTPRAQWLIYGHHWWKPSNTTSTDGFQTSHDATCSCSYMANVLLPSRSVLYTSILSMNRVTMLQWW